MLATFIGYSQILKSDNSLQFSFREFKELNTNWNFEHITSSSYHTWANGSAERRVQIAKNISRKCRMEESENQLTLLNYRNIPGSSTLASLAFSKITRSTIPLCSDKSRVEDNVKQELEKARPK